MCFPSDQAGIEDHIHSNEPDLKNYVKDASYTRGSQGPHSSPLCSEVSIPFCSPIRTGRLIFHSPEVHPGAVFLLPFQMETLFPSAFCMAGHSRQHGVRAPTPDLKHQQGQTPWHRTFFPQNRPLSKSKVISISKTRALTRPSPRALGEEPPTARVGKEEELRGHLPVLPLDCHLFPPSPFLFPFIFFSTLKTSNFALGIEQNEMSLTYKKRDRGESHASHYIQAL